MQEDEKIKKNVVDQLYWDSRVDASDIKVEVNNGSVELTGTVPSLGAKDAAMNTAFLIRGVTAVINSLEVQMVAEVPTDAELGSEIDSVLLWNPDLDSTKIEASVLDGKVVLKGSVDAYWKKIEAERSVSHVAGVTAVENNLAIVRTEKLADELIADDIMHAFERNIYINPEDIHVEVKEGIVSLSGKVDSIKARNEAIATAQYTHGVMAVEDKGLVVNI